MTKPIRVLIIEDSADDATLMERALKKGGYEPQVRRVETPEAMNEALATERWDAILADFTLPRFSGGMR